MQVIVVEKVGRKFVQTQTINVNKKTSKSRQYFSNAGSSDGSVQRCKMGQTKGKFRWR